MRKAITTTSLLFLLAGLSSCFKHSYTTGNGATLDNAQVYSAWHHHFIAGFIGERTVNIYRECPSGNALVKESTTVANSLLSIITGGLYTPTTVKIYCGPGAAKAAATSRAESGQVQPR